MRACLVTVLALLLVAAAPQEKPAAPKGKSAAPKGALKPSDDVPGTFEPYNLNGKFKGRFHCLVCQDGLNPVAAVFVKGTDDLEGVAALLQALDAALKTRKNEKAGLAAFAIFVDEKLPDVVGDDDQRDELAKKLDDVAGKLERVAVALEGRGNLDKYRLDPDADVTLLLYNKLKVVEVQTLAKGKLNKESIAPLVNDIVAKLVAKK